VFDAKAAEQYDASGAVQSVRVTYPDGSEVGYGKNSDGSFSPPQGRFATFKSVTGGYTLTDKNDTVYTFTQSLGQPGRLTGGSATAAGRGAVRTDVLGFLSRLFLVRTGRRDRQGCGRRRDRRRRRRRIGDGGCGGAGPFPRR
jgi:hypothetical protein